jgi:hypothetical protein
MAFHVNMKRFSEWRVLLLLFVFVLVYPAAFRQTLEALVRPDEDTWGFERFSIYESALWASVLIPPWALSMRAALGFRRSTTPSLWALVLATEAFRLSCGGWSWPYSLDSVAWFLFFLLPWLFLRSCLRWRCCRPSAPSTSDIDPRDSRQFDLAALLSAVTAIGILLACHRSKLSQGGLQFAEVWWPNEIIRYLPFYPSGYCLAWVVLADGQARQIGLGAFVSSSLGWIGFAYFTGVRSHILKREKGTGPICRNGP